MRVAVMTAPGRSVSRIVRTLDRYRRPVGGGLRSPRRGEPAWHLDGYETRARANAPARGIRVNAVCPGTIDTYGRAHDGNRRPGPGCHLTRVPMARLGSSDEIASAVLWLCSPGASFVTGVALPVDRGFTAQ